VAVTAPALGDVIWSGFAGDPQHTAQSSVGSQALQSIKWQTPVDLQPQYSGGDLLIHYGSVTVTPTNTVIVPVKTGQFDGFKVSAFDGGTGAAEWTSSTDYILPAHDWTPSYSPALTSSGRLYYPGAGGTVYYRDGVGTGSPGPVNQLAFYGNAAYAANKAAFNSSVFIDTPITSDALGNIYFGYQATGALNPANVLAGGIARITPSGAGTFISAVTLTGDNAINHVQQNSAPALSHDGSTLYVAVSDGSSGYLLALNSTTLARQAGVLLKDPHNGNLASINDASTASPTIGPDGDVYFGVLENPGSSNHDRGWLLHFSANLATTKAPGAFGWDDTASVVPASMVPSYSGSSQYLLMTKYNNYGSAGGDGINKLAIVDPGSTEIDPITGQTVMKEVLTIAGVTPDLEFPGLPNAVREWCINSAVADPATDSILAGSEDGKLYRWNLTTNTFSEVITLTSGIGEAYTPTVIGADGTVYAVNNATLFAVGVPEAGVAWLALAVIPMARFWRPPRSCRRFG
jgi:hypothetical protein